MGLSPTDGGKIGSLKATLGCAYLQPVKGKGKQVDCIKKSGLRVGSPALTASPFFLFIVEGNRLASVNGRYIH